MDVNRPPDSSRGPLAGILWFVAAALALAAAAVRYARHGEIWWYLVAAALFLAAMGAGALRRAPRSGS